mgnify:CR=1 FL=1
MSGPLTIKASSNDYPYKDVGRRLAELRTALGMKPAEVCRRTGINPSLWSQFEKGKRRIPIDDAITLRNLFGAPLDWTYLGDSSGLPLRLADILGILPDER